MMESNHLRDNFQVPASDASWWFDQDLRLSADVLLAVQVPADQREDHGRRGPGHFAALLRFQ